MTLQMKREALEAELVRKRCSEPFHWEKRDWHTCRTNAKVNPRSQASERFLDLNRSSEESSFRF